jgi:CheY-like chemotaxis protein
MRILVADDSPVLRMAVSKLLEAEGFEVSTAADGIEAVTSVYEQPPDLILLDVKMPRLTGYVACRLIKEDPLTSQIPVLILTSLDSEEDRYWGKSSGADGYVTKDALGTGLVSAINSALATRALTDLTSAQAMPVVNSMGAADVLTRVCEMLDRKLFEMTVVNSMTAIGMKSVSVPVSIDRVFEEIRHVVQYEVGAVVVAETRHVHYWADPSVGQDGLKRLQLLAADTVARYAGTKSQPNSIRLVEVGQSSERATEGKPFESVFSAPLRGHGSLIGGLILASTRPMAFPDQVLSTMRTLVPAAAGVVESALSFRHAMERVAQSNLSALSGR